jgi:hypothetical protein
VKAVEEVVQQRESAEKIEQAAEKNSSRIE